MFTNMSNSSSVVGTNFTEFNKTFSFAFRFYIFPVVAVFGVIANVLAVIVLRRQNPQKSSTIFILALTVADIVYLVGAIKVSTTLCFSAGGKVEFQYSENVAMFLFILMCFETSVYSCGTFTTFLLPICITIERFLAVYFPFNFRRILTPRRAKCVVVIIFILWIPLIAFIASVARYTYTEQGVGVVQALESSQIVLGLYNFMQDSCSVFVGPVSVGIVLIGSFFIVFKIYQQEQKRKQLTLSSTSVFSVTSDTTVTDTKSKDKHTCPASETEKQNTVVLDDVESTGPGVSGDTMSYLLTIKVKGCMEILHHETFSDTQETETKTIVVYGEKLKTNVSTSINCTGTAYKKRNKTSLNRTTRSMLAVSVMYSITNILAFLCSFRIGEITADSDAKSILATCAELALCVNCAMNSFVYVATNRNFRKDYWKLISHCCIHSTRK